MLIVRNILGSLGVGWEEIGANLGREALKGIIVNYTLVAKDPTQLELFGFGGERLTVFHDCRPWLLGGKLLSTLGLSPPKIQASNFISEIQEKPPKPCEIHVPNSVCFFQIFRGKFAKYPGPLHSKNTKNIKIFHKQIPKRHSKSYEIHVPNSDFISGGLFGGNLLSTLGLPPPKMQKENPLAKS